MSEGNLGNGFHILRGQYENNLQLNYLCGILCEALFWVRDLFEVFHLIMKCSLLSVCSVGRLGRGDEKGGSGISGFVISVMEFSCYPLWKLLGDNSGT